MELINGLFTVENLIALLTLTALEIVLGIDNIVFLAILSSRVPPEQQAKARRVGLVAAMLMRIVLLLGVGWVAKLDHAWATFDIVNLKIAVSGRNLILFLGGLVLMFKSVREIQHKMDFSQDPHGPGARAARFGAVIVQIMLMDIVFSIDSVITAVGMAQSIVVMVTAVVISVGIMIIFAGPISHFVDKHPSLKMLALSFLLLIGVMLVAESLGSPVSKGYVYFAMAFALAVEFMNIRVKKVEKLRAGS